ncbi:unnamed protein product, partial [Staurois parvus]
SDGRETSCCQNTIVQWKGFPHQHIERFSFFQRMNGQTRGGLTIWKLGHCPRARGQ